MVVLTAPAAVILLGLIVYPVALLLGMAGLDAGARFVESFLDALRAAFSPAGLPTWIPRLAASSAAGVGAGAGRRGAGSRGGARRCTGERPATAPGRCSARRSMPSGAIDRSIEAVWRLLKGGAAIKTPEPQDLSRRYAELLTDNLGQPGFRELLLVVHDLDARRDLVFGLLRDPYRKMLFPPPGGVSSRRAEAHDLSAGTQAVHRRRAGGVVEPARACRIRGWCALRPMPTGAAKPIG